MSENKTVRINTFSECNGCELVFYRQYIMLQIITLEELFIQNFETNLFNNPM